MTPSWWLAADAGLGCYALGGLLVFLYWPTVLTRRRNRGVRELRRQRLRLLLTGSRNRRKDAR